MNLRKYSIIVIVIMAGLFRFMRIESIPPSLYWDEVSQAYNSYSILKTGYDEHKELMPIARFKAFGDYKAPVYIYLDVPFIALLGKTNLAVRFPSALFGTLTVLVCYFLVKELFFKNKNKNQISLAAAFFLAISPWHIQLSRVAYEGNLATFFTILGITLFLLSLRKQKWILIFSIISFIIGFYAFNAHRVFIPLFIFLIFSIYFRQIAFNRRLFLALITLSIILLLPIILYLRSPESKLRFNEVNIFTNIDTIKRSNVLMEQDKNSSFSRIIHNRRIQFMREYLINYFDFFEPTYLFIKGDINPRFSHRANGQLYLWMIPILTVGVYSLLAHANKSTLLILGWFVLAPIAAATARETPHALRSSTFIPTYEIIAAVGFSVIYTTLQRYSTKIRFIIFFICGLIVSFSVFNFFHNYFTHNPKQFSNDWQYGYKQVIEKVELLKSKYDVIYFTTTYGRPYIYAAWYGNYTPNDFWKEVRVLKDTQGFYNVTSIGKYIFSEPLSNSNKKVLVVTTPDKLPSWGKILDKVDFLDGKTAFIIYDE